MTRLCREVTRKRTRIVLGLGESLAMGRNESGEPERKEGIVKGLQCSSFGLETVNIKNKTQSSDLRINV